jgi:hypothetical protein
LLVSHLSLLTLTAVEPHDADGQYPCTIRPNRDAEYTDKLDQRFADGQD